MAPNTKQVKITNKQTKKEISKDSWCKSWYFLCQLITSGAAWMPVCLFSGVSELQRAELLVDGQDVVVQLGGEQQVLQGSHVLLDGHMMLRDERKAPRQREKAGQNTSCSLQETPQSQASLSKHTHNVLQQKVHFCQYLEFCFLNFQNLWF